MQNNDIKELRVKFVKFQGEILALFPDLKEKSGFIQCYAHSDQHGTAQNSLLKCKRAKPEEYFSLYMELLSIYTRKKYENDTIFILKIV